MAGGGLVRGNLVIQLLAMDGHVEGETFRRDDRARFLVHALRIAHGRPLHFKFHPNEDQARARREVLTYCPRAHIHERERERERTEELIANCAVLITQVSSVTFVGLALGKEVHSDLDLGQLSRLLPLQNGGSSARNIAAECRLLLAQRAPHSLDTPHRQRASA